MYVSLQNSPIHLTFGQVKMSKLQRLLNEVASQLALLIVS